MKTQRFEEDDYVQDEEEVLDRSGFDLRNKSLTNTQKKEAEAKKAVLPLKSIMKEILDKPVSENAQKVRKTNQEIHCIFKEESDSEKCRKRKEKCEVRSHKKSPQKESSISGKSFAQF